MGGPDVEKVKNSALDMTEMPVKHQSGYVKSLLDV